MRVLSVSLPCLVLLCLCGFATEAHQLSDSFLVMQVTNAQIIGHWDIALKDLLHSQGLDPLDQNLLNFHSLDPEAEMKAAKVLSRLKIKSDGAPVEIKC